MAQETESISEAVAAPRRKMSFEEFLEWADEDAHAEWVDGEVVEMSPASERHQNLSGFLVASLRIFAEARDLGIVYPSAYLMKIDSTRSSREPDILFVANANRERCKTNYLDGPADLAVEIVSPESAKRDRGEKFVEYETGGVLEYWLIDPIRRQADFYRRGEDGFYRAAPLDEEGRYRSAVLPGLWLKPEWLWRDPLPSTFDIFREWRLI